MVAGNNSRVMLRWRTAHKRLERTAMRAGLGEAVRWLSYRESVSLRWPRSGPRRMSGRGAVALRGSLCSHLRVTEMMILPRRHAAGGCAREDGVELVAVVIEGREQRAGKHAAARQLDAHRINEAIVDDDLEMHMRAGGEPRRADESDNLALAHVAADIEPARERGHMAVCGLVTVGVADAHIFAVAALLSDLADVAIAGGEDRRAGRGGPIDAGMQFAHFEERMRAPAEA